MHRGGPFCDSAGPESGTRADLVDEHLARLTTRSSRLFIRTASVIFGDRKTGDAGEFAGEATSLRLGGSPVPCYRRQTGLDRMATNPPGLSHVAAPDLVLLYDHLLMPLGLGLVIKGLVLNISSGKITALF